jgi:hypothetical protein
LILLCEINVLELRYYITAIFRPICSATYHRVIPAKAGTHSFGGCEQEWIPAFAGMTSWVELAMDDLTPCPAHIGDIGDGYARKHEGHGLVADGQRDRHGVQQGHDAEGDLDENEQG